MNFSIVPAHLAVKAMRDNGYKNAAYAIAELMDNAIQAGAKNVELLCAEQTTQLAQRTRRRVHQIAVLDDASGMDKDTLRIALQFGNGTRLDEANQTGIGRFGMGLPASSISQCQKVEVWSWRGGVANAIYTYLDLGEIASQKMTEVPEPIAKAIPELWKRAGNEWGDSGTLVVWSILDRLMWKTAATIIDNSEFVIGRMYRRFLKKDQVRIRMAAFDIDRPENVTVDEWAKPNDPGYLSTGTSTPAPWDDSPMFEKWGGEDGYEVTHKIEFRGEQHPVKIRYSVAKEEARQGINPGSRDYGKHAAKNEGLSVVRAGRELELDDGWADPSEPRDRWWGIEVEFPPALDEIFGVTNNKQHAHGLSELAKLDLDNLLKDGRSLGELREQLDDDEDPRAPLIEIAHQIQKTRNVLRRLLRAQTASEERRDRTRHPDPNSPESRATEITRHRQEEGHEGQSDAGEQLPADQRQSQIEGELASLGMPAAAAKELAATTISDGLKYVFAEADLESMAFFSVKQRGGSIIITLNTSHPAFGSLVEVLEKDATGEDDASLRERLTTAAGGLKLLLMAWARYEDEQPDGPRRNQAQETRADWGRLARQFLNKDG
ncbi:ATP-binding protein [bacterium M00.F.Ca.ET.141.01.1.1]|nr:ATP-binding protein [bacterium M00.F.Ca.ET.141.01.1.1]